MVCGPLDVGTALGGGGEGPDLRWHASCRCGLWPPVDLAWGSEPVVGGPLGAGTPRRICAQSFPFGYVGTKGNADQLFFHFLKPYRTSTYI
jgi:hypothetical protein